ncbi:MULTISPECIES: hypothetical protein [unclassified Streptomyces]|uniref:hypothetical protein n=1 Tax=unclassified Streptomyces TaxID=2593676 RepID=UPI002DD93923|nr:hypothetical protein [Streptomyces sp. NBC_00243]WRZ17953.1 hypothetical protein OHT59_05340 [Streptomyces sp. NBC_00243]
MAIESPRYGIRSVAWTSIREDLFPDHPDSAYWDGSEAVEMNRLRGMVMVQAAETEAVLGIILSRLDPAARRDRPSGQLLQAIRGTIGGHCDTEWPPALDVIEQAIKRRNRAVHDSPAIGRTWRAYATGGGEWVHVTTMLGEEECDISTLLKDLALQQDATAAAVEVLHCLTV